MVFVLLWNIPGFVLTRVKTVLRAGCVLHANLRERKVWEEGFQIRLFHSCWGTIIKVLSEESKS
jgi:hypothetical protein